MLRIHRHVGHVTCKCPILSLTNTPQGKNGTRTITRIDHSRFKATYVNHASGPIKEYIFTTSYNEMKYMSCITVRGLRYTHRLGNCRRGDRGCCREMRRGRLTSSHPYVGLDEPSKDSKPFPYTMNARHRHTHYMIVSARSNECYIQSIEYGSF